MLRFRGRPGLPYRGSTGIPVSIPLPLTFSPEFWVNSAGAGFSPTSGAVDSYLDPSSNAHSFTSSSTARPSLGSSVLTFDGVNDMLTAITAPQLVSRTVDGFGNSTLPSNVLAGTVNKGYTITGFCKLPNGNYATGNHGKAQDTDPSYTPSIVILGPDKTTLVSEIPILPLDATAGSIQGTACRITTGDIAACSYTDNKILVVTQAGVLVTSFTTTGANPNGICWNSDNDSWIVMYDGGASGNTFDEYRCSDNVLIRSYTVATPLFSDGLYYDTAKKGTWISAGANGTNAELYFYNLTYQTLSPFITIAGAKTVEGLHIEGNTILTANDSYYHPFPPQVNNITTGKFTSRAAEVFDITIVGQISAAPSGYDGVIWSHGDPDSGAYVAVMVVDGTSNQIKVGASDGTRTGSATFTLPTTMLNTDTQIEVVINFKAKSARVYQNGTYVSTGALGTTINQNILTSSYYIGGSPSGRNLALKLKDMSLQAYEMSDTDRNTLGQYYATKDSLSYTLSIILPVQRVAGVVAFYDVSDATTVTQAANLCSQLNDKIGTRHWTASLLERSTYSSVNGTLTFNGTTNIMYHTSPFMYANGKITVIAKMKAAAQSGKYLVGEANTTTSPPAYGLLLTNPTAANNQSYAFLRNDANTTNSILDGAHNLGTTNMYNNTVKVAMIKDSGTRVNANDNGTPGTVNLDYTRAGVLTLNVMSLFGIRKWGGVAIVNNGLLAGDLYNMTIIDHNLTPSEEDYLRPLVA